jgi:DNA-binding SARP family transcriptional activator/tetratricopeptide (TPR) repeat protein
MIRLRLLGGIDLRDSDSREIRPVLAQPKRLALLAYLAAATPRGPRRRDTLLGLFWPELDQEHGRNALSQALRFLRRALGEAALAARGAEVVALDPTMVWCDAAAFADALAEDRPDEALRLYRGDLLPSFFAEGSAGFEEWLERERATLRTAAAGAARRLAERHEAGRQPTAAVAFARRAVDLSSGDERPLRRLIELLARLGDRAGAIRAYEEFARRLAAELEVEPTAETVALMQRVRADREPATGAASPITAAPSGDATPAPPLDRFRSALAGRYEIEEELGAGAMAVVFRAADLRHRRRVAIKVLRPELAALMGPERFLYEIDIAAGLVHPHILPLHDSGEAAGLLYYVMPYIEGASLRDRLLDQGRLPVADAVRITREIADALDYAHGKGLIHRDIKPENILLNQGHALLADFGIARAIGAAGGEPLAAAQRATGTPAYMSPEQVLGIAPLDARTDIYALGCVLYEMLAGRLPFPGPGVDAVIAQRLAGPPQPVSRLREEAGTELDTALAEALAPEPEARFGRVADFAAALMPGGRLPAASPRRTRLARLAAAVALAFALSGLGLWRGTSARGGPTADPAVVAIMPFRVAGADPSLGYLRQGMMDLLAARLTGEGGLRAADLHALQRALGGAGDTADADLPAGAAARVARRIGAGLLLQGTVVGVPERLVITASLSGGRLRGPARTAVEGPSDSLLALTDRLAREILALGAGAGTQQLSSLTTTSLEAVRAYLDGQAAYRRGAYGESIRLFDRAVGLDSSFALAAAALVKADGWAEYKHGPEIAALAWRNRAPLSERDRVLLSLRLGDRYPRWTPAALQIEAAERATRLIPESPESWFELGDRLFHLAALAGVPDGRRRAEVMLRRALARDSMYGPALGHLVSLAAERGDTGELSRVTARLLTVDTTEWPAFAARWRLAAAQRDPRAIAEFIAALDRREPNGILNFARDELGDSVGIAWLDGFLQAARPKAVATPERELYAWLAWNAATNRGRPAEAAVWLDSLMPHRRRNLPILGWLAGADTTGMGEAARREARLATATGGAGYPSAPFLMEAGKLYRKDLSSVDRTVVRLRRDPVLRDSLDDTHLLAAQLLESWAAVERGSPAAHALVDMADSMLVGRGDFMAVEGANWLVAHLYDRLAAPGRALAAIRRRPYMATFVWPAGLAETSRHEGRWAAATGDREGAVRAYRRYLAWRAAPAPEKTAQRDSVRVELAGLEFPLSR